MITMNQMYWLTRLDHSIGSLIAPMTRKVARMID